MATEHGDEEKKILAESIVLLQPDVVCHGPLVQGRYLEKECIRVKVWSVEDDANKQQHKRRIEESLLFLDCWLGGLVGHHRCASQKRPRIWGHSSIFFTRTTSADTSAVCLTHVNAIAVAVGLSAVCLTHVNAIAVTDPVGLSAAVG